MGIYDRDYYRREGPSFLGAFTERGRVCRWLIGLNILAFLVQVLTRDTVQLPGFGRVVLGPGWFTQAFILDVDRVVHHGEVWRLLTAAFLHDPGSIWHIVFNMLFLWWFGSDMEDLYGPREFLAFYLVGAVLSNCVFVLGELAQGPRFPELGASGAVTAVLVLYAIHYPTRVIYLFFFLPVPIWLFVVFSVGQDAFQFLGGGAGTDPSRPMVAVGAHVGGAAFALAYYKLHWRLSTWWPGLWEWRKRLRQPRLRVYREEEPPRTPVTVAVPAPPEDEQLEAKMDAILEKISRTGKESLTEGERQLLLRASEIYKRRRT